MTLNYEYKPQNSFYYEQVIKIRENNYPKDYLIKQIINAKYFIDINFATKINLDEISKKVFISKFHFIRLFKMIYGRTPYQYLTEVRIEKAKQFLKNDKTVIDVCFFVGFESVSSFTTLFKKITGNTPSGFQKSHKIFSLNTGVILKYNPTEK